MAKKLYRIPVEWAVTGMMLIEADSLAQAIADADDAPLPEAKDYIDGSFNVNTEMVEFYNKTKENSSPDK